METHHQDISKHRWSLPAPTINWRCLVWEHHWHHPRCVCALCNNSKYKHGYSLQFWGENRLHHLMKHLLNMHFHKTKFIVFQNISCFSGIVTLFTLCLGSISVEISFDTSKKNTCKLNFPTLKHLFIKH